MTPNLPQIMTSEFNRTARLEEANAHRLWVASGVAEDRAAARQQVMNAVISRVKNVLGSLRRTPQDHAVGKVVSAAPHKA